LHPNLANDLYSIYLRKSREDMEAELHNTTQLKQSCCVIAALKNQVLEVFLYPFS
jgi:hypothetical protein